MSGSKRTQILDLECRSLPSDCMQLGPDNLGEGPKAEVLRQEDVLAILPDATARQKSDLECLRAAADCMQLVGEVRNPELQRHFLDRASQLTAAVETSAQQPVSGPSDII